MRYFTLSEANRALVLIQPIVSDMLEKRNKLARLEKTVHGMRQRRDHRDIPKLQRTEHEFRILIEGIEHHMNEILQVGCIMKDINRGLVDFPSWHEGREILLCWQAGEKEVVSWHDTHGGFMTRKSVDDTFRVTYHEPLSADSIPLSY